MMGFKDNSNDMMITQSSEAIPEGYKSTAIGLLPIDWTVDRFDEVFELITTNSFSRDNLTYVSTINGIQNIHYGDIHSTFDGEILDCTRYELPHIKDELIRNQKFNFLRDGDLVIADASEDYEGVGKCIELKNVGFAKIVSGLHTFLARDNSGKTSNGFRTYIFNNPKVTIELKKIATGISVYSISKGNLQKLLLPIPPKLEQQKIAQILATWDDAIVTENELIKNLKHRNQALANQLLTGQKRINGFDDVWEETTIEKVTKNFSTRNKELINARIYSVTNYNGFVYQSDHFSREVAGDDLTSYKIIRKNEFAYNPARINVGSIAFFNDDVGVISSLYVCFKTNEKVANPFFIEWLKIEKTRHDIERYGEGGVRIYLWYDLFKKIKISLPSLEEQKAIVDVLEVGNQEVIWHEAKLRNFHEQKKGLMQQLLTGKVRVIVG